MDVTKKLKNKLDVHLTTCHPLFMVMAQVRNIRGTSANITVGSSGSSGRTRTSMTESREGETSNLQSNGS